MSWKRIICCVRGHKQYPLREPLEIPEKKNGLGIYSSWLTGMRFHDINFGNGPLAAQAYVCTRCYGVIWSGKVNPKYFDNSDNVPELKKYRKWLKRLEWEEEQRAKNPTAEKLYKQYQMMLKLAHAEDEE